MSSSELTIRVQSLAAADKFYDKILRPIGYQFQSRVRHDLSDGRHTIESTYGPVNTDRVDLRLSQSSQRTIPSKEERAQIEFHAPSVFAVRQFFEAAVQAGAKIAAHPRAEGGRFTAGIRDLDGNIVQAAYDNPMAAGSKDDRLAVSRRPASEGDSDNNSTIVNWVRGVADDTTPQHPPEPGPRMVVPKSSAPIQASRSRNSTSVPRTRRPASPLPARSHQRATDHIDLSVKNIIAGAVAISAGAALAFGAYKEFADSKERENDHHRAFRRREELEAEVRAHARVSDGVAKRSADRHSGYYSVTSVTTIVHGKQSPPPPDYTSKDGRRSYRLHERPHARTYSDPRSRSTASSASASTIKPLRAIEARPSSSRRSRRGSVPVVAIKKRSCVTV